MNATNDAFSAISLVETSQLSSRLIGSISGGEHDSRSPVSVTTGENERPERMRDWVIRCVYVYVQKQQQQYSQFELKEEICYVVVTS